MPTEADYRRSYLSRGDRRGDDVRNGGRSRRLPHRRGRRPVRWRLQGDEGLPGEVRAAACRRHTDRGNRIHGPGGGRGTRRAAPDRRIPVRRLHLVRVRSHHQRDGTASLPHGRRDAGHDASAVRCATSGRSHALSERRILLRARARFEDRHARHPAGRGGSADQCDQGQQPGPVPGEQVPVPQAAQRRTDQSRRHPTGSGQRGPPGQRRHADHVFSRRVAGHRDRG